MATVIEFFREGELEECRYVMQRASDILGERLREPKPKVQQKRSHHKRKQQQVNGSLGAVQVHLSSEEAPF